MYSANLTAKKNQRPYPTPLNHGSTPPSKRWGGGELWGRGRKGEGKQTRHQYTRAHSLENCPTVNFVQSSSLTHLLPEWKKFFKSVPKRSLITLFVCTLSKVIVKGPRKITLTKRDKVIKPSRDKIGEVSVTPFSDYRFFASIMSNQVGAMNGIPRWRPVPTRGNFCPYFPVSRMSYDSGVSIKIIPVTLLTSLTLLAPDPKLSKWF